MYGNGLRGESGIGRDNKGVITTGEIDEGEISFGIGLALGDEGAARSLKLNGRAGRFRRPWNRGRSLVQKRQFGQNPSGLKRQRESKDIDVPHS